MSMAMGTTMKMMMTKNDDYETRTSTMTSSRTKTTATTTMMTTMMTTTKTSTATMDNLTIFFYNIIIIIWAALGANQRNTVV